MIDLFTHTGRCSKIIKTVYSEYVEISEIQKNVTTVHCSAKQCRASDAGHGKICRAAASIDCIAFSRHEDAPLYLGFVVMGAMLGALRYFPYFAHEGRLVTRFLPHAISYEGTELLDYVTSRGVTYTIYVAVVIGPLLLSSDFRVKIFGLLVTLVLAVTYFFFSYAYISVFCFGGAVMSLYLVWMVFGTGHGSRGIPIPSG